MCQYLKWPYIFIKFFLCLHLKVRKSYLNFEREEVEADLPSGTLHLQPTEKVEQKLDKIKSKTTAAPCRFYLCVIQTNFVFSWPSFKVGFHLWRIKKKPQTSSWFFLGYCQTLELWQLKKHLSSLKQSLVLPLEMLSFLGYFLGMFYIAMLISKYH